MAEKFLLEKTAVNGSRPAADATCRLTSGLTGITRVITIACFVMQILLPAGLSRKKRLQVTGSVTTLWYSFLQKRRKRNEYRRAKRTDTE